MKVFAFVFLLTTCLGLATERPNICVFLTDDQSQLDASPYGEKTIRTPNMQRLADEGMTFERAYVASPSCAPSRAALLTGLMPARNGAEANHSKPRTEIKKWPTYFQELGYEVVAFGKVSHYKHTADYGFDHFAFDGFHQHEAIPAAVDYLKNRKTEKPLCFMVGSNWPHVPWPETAVGYDPAQLSLPAKSVDTPKTREWRARYASAVTKADEELGVIMTAVKQYLGEKTLILFSADHGAQWPYGKWNCYESGVKVPLLVSWPGVIKPGSRSQAMVQWTDFLPTLVEAAGGKPPADIDGKSIIQVLRGETAIHRTEVFTTHSNDGRFNVYPMRAVRNERWKYIRNLHPEFAFTSHIDLPVKLGQRDFFATWETADPAAVQRYHQRPADELYDLQTDPNEEHNLAHDPAHAGELQKLRGTLDQWIASQGDKLSVFEAPRLLSDPTSYGPKAITPPTKGSKK